MDLINKIYTENNIDSGIDLIFSEIDSWFSDGMFSLCDIFLIEIDPLKLNIDYIIAILSITLSARNKLQNRDTFLKRSYPVLGERRDSLLKGLI
jgi:hypothetical protein